MTNTKGLSLWIDTKIGKGKDYRSIREFADAFSLNEKTVRNIRKGRNVDSGTLDKLADGAGLALPDFLKMIEEFTTNPKDKRWLITQIEGRLNELTESEARSVQALVDSLLENRKSD